MKSKYFLLFYISFLILKYHDANAQPNTWVRVPDYPGNCETSMVSFGIGNSIFAGTGEFLTPPYIAVDIWQLDLTTHIWTSKADYGGYPKRYATTFTINGLGYITGGDYSDMWAFDVSANNWSQKSNFPGGNRNNPISFTIGNMGYFGLGKGGFYKNDFWEYNPDSNSWTQKMSFLGSAREQAVGFAVAGYGFVGCGFDGSFIKKDFWRYDPSNDAWIQVADIPGPERYLAVSFTINNSAFVVGGESNNPILNDCWQYNPFTDSWIQKASYPGGPIVAGIGSSANGFGFVGTGNTGGGNSRMCYKYIPDQSININDITNENPISISSDYSHSLFTISGIRNCEKLELYDLVGHLINVYYLPNDQESYSFTILNPGIYLANVLDKYKKSNSVFKIYNPSMLK